MKLGTYGELLELIQIRIKENLKFGSTSTPVPN